MAGKLTVNKMTHNKISVTWDVSNQTLVNSTGPVTSTTFSLLTDGILIVFSLMIETGAATSSGSQEYRVTVKPNLQKSGRAIITLSLDNPLTTVFLRTHLLEYWERDYVFDYPAPSPQTIRDAAKNVRGYVSTSSIIKCDITWLGFHGHVGMPRTPHIPKQLSLLRIPYTNQLIPDVKLIMDGKELSAHKNVLTLSSPVFLKMFESPMKESKENRVVIEDVDFTTMETLLKIIYSGETEALDNQEVALKVLAATEKYEMLTIKTACEYKLQLQVEKANVLKLLEEGDKYNAAELLQLCIEYIIAARDIIPVDKLKEMCLTRPNLSTALISTQMEKLCFIPSNSVRSLY